MSYSKAVLKHLEWKGKIEMVAKAPVSNKEELALAYTPGVAGTYLAALIHAGTLFNINPKDVTYVPTFTIEASGGNRIQPTAEDCEALRSVAYDIIYNLDLSVLD